MKEMNENEINNLQTSYLKEPLYCSLVDTLDFLGMRLGNISSVEIWSLAKDCLSKLIHSERPDLLVPGMFLLLSKQFESDDIPAVIMICVMYMICSDVVHDDVLTVASKKIAATLFSHPLFDFISKQQRKGEENEEMAGNPVPISGYVSSAHDFSELLRDGCDIKGLAFNDIPHELRSCIADISKVAEYSDIIRYQILPFIESEEGTQQLWKIVMDVSKDCGYITNRCSVLKFAGLLTFICPEAGETQKLKQNIDKYSWSKEKKDNDYSAIYSRFSEGQGKFHNP